MKVSRRTLIKAGAVAAATGSSPALGTPPTLVVFDSSIGESRAFAMATGGNRIDIAAQHAENWRAFRTALPSGRIAGLTRWTDLVIARGYAEEQGKRLRFETRRNSLFAWELI